MSQASRGGSPTGEYRIREAFQYAAAGMAITDLDGRFQETNPAYNRILDRTEEELQHETILSVTDPADREDCGEQIARLVAGDIPSFVTEKRYLRVSGEPIWVRNSFSLLKDQGGVPTHIILICDDITERRRAERLLIESEKLATVGQLTSSIAHEINDPVEAAMNLLYLAQEASTLDEAKQYAAEAERQVRHVAQIATDTLRFRKDTSRPAAHDISELLHSVLTLYKGKLMQARVRIHLDRRDSPHLICFAGEIRQVFANLIRNAIDAMPEGGDLRVRLKPGTDWRSGAPGVRITVSDTGHGIHPKIREQIYEPFFTTKGTQGTGLGLWVTARILKKHRGSMHVRSSNSPQRSWTAFTLAFPCSGAEGENAGLGEIR
jgi:PAS domain S-box-containing protein